MFATETLAAGINMPARTVVLSSLSKRGDDGHALLTTNSMLQMAGRAGRRGYDDAGFVVAMQTMYEGADQCLTILQRPPESLTSQFAPSYGMVRPLCVRELSFGGNINASASRLRQKLQQLKSLHHGLEVLNNPLR